MKEGGRGAKGRKGEREGKEEGREEGKGGGRGEKGKDWRDGGEGMEGKELPHQLSDHLRVSSDSHDSCLPHVKLGLVHSSDLEQVEGGGVEEPEAHEIHHPAHGVHRVRGSHVPQLYAIISMVDEEHDAGDGKRQADHPEEDSPNALPYSFLLQQTVDGRLSFRPQRRETTVGNTEDGEEEEHGCCAVVTADGRQEPDEVIAEPSLRVNPQEPQRSHDDSEDSNELGPRRD